MLVVPVVSFKHRTPTEVLRHFRLMSAFVTRRLHLSQSVAEADYGSHCEGAIIRLNLFTGPQHSLKSLAARGAAAEEFI